MRITNTTRGDLILSPGGRVPAGGYAEISDADVRAAKKSPVVAAWFKSGALAHAGDKVEPKASDQKAAEGKS